MKPRERIRKAWNDMEDRASALASTASDDMKEKIDTELGIYLHKNVGTLFYFDAQIREYEDEIIEFARAGQKDKAMAKSMEMQNYIQYEMKHNRRYKSRLKDIAEKVEDRRDSFTDKIEKLEGGRLIRWLQNRNTMDIDQMEERMQKEE